MRQIEQLILDKKIPNLLKLEYDKPSGYILNCWNEYQKHTENKKDLKDKILAYILAVLLIREGIAPVCMSAKVALGPDVIYDLMFYTTERGQFVLVQKQA